MGADPNIKCSYNGTSPYQCLNYKRNVPYEYFILFKRYGYSGPSRLSTEQKIRSRSYFKKLTLTLEPVLFFDMLSVIYKFL